MFTKDYHLCHNEIQSISIFYKSMTQNEISPPWTMTYFQTDLNQQDNP